MLSCNWWKKQKYLTGQLHSYSEDTITVKTPLQWRHHYSEDVMWSPRFYGYYKLIAVSPANTTKMKTCNIYEQVFNSSLTDVETALVWWERGAMQRLIASIYLMSMTAQHLHQNFTASVMMASLSRLSTSKSPLRFDQWHIRNSGMLIQDLL